jgi:diketogulonate reductase-like aldo/keto reductase
MSKVLVIVLSETRASELTFNSFKKNVIDELNADLCICIGIKPDYDYTNPFYNLAKYKFTYNEPDDFGDAFEYAYNIICKNRPKYECLENTNALYGKIQHPTQTTENITYYGDEPFDVDKFDDDEIVVHTNNFPDDLWKNQVYGIKNSDNILVSQENVITYKKPLYWREFLKIVFLGWGVKGAIREHPASSGILLFFRWFLLKNLIDNDLINKYDRFIITRSDYIYQLPHPKVELMSDNIWIPDCEYYNGYTDRHVILSKQNIIPYLNIFNNMVLSSNEYFMKMKDKEWNLEQLIKLHLEQNNVIHLVKEFPYVMYSVRNINGTTRWAEGNFSNELGYYIKYHTEYDKSTHYKNMFQQSGLTIDEFYKPFYDKIPLPMMGIGVGGFDYNTTYGAVVQALTLGYRLIDTAENYYNEEAVGNAIIDSGINRNEIVIISKYFGGHNYGNPGDVINSFNNSLDKLKTNYIDIYLIHMPFGCKWANEWEPIVDNKFTNYKNRLSVWMQMIELKKQKLVNYIGVSNWTLRNIEELNINNLNLPDIIQIEWCPSFYDKPIYEFCKEHCIKIIGYGLFSTNSIDEIKSIELNEKNKHPSEILIKWCTQRNVIVIPRSNNEKLMMNMNTYKSSWLLSEYDLNLIDSIIQKNKGHCLKNVYEKNYNINLWNPFINNLDTTIDKVDELINGNISCIIVNALTKNNCIDILKKMENKNLLKNQLPYDNYGIHFRGNEIGITIDNMLWRGDRDKYFNECIKVNHLFENIFDKINPFDVMFKTIQRIAGDNYTLTRMKHNDIQCPKGVFRVFSKSSPEFPYHTDGFNYGNILNNITNIDKTIFPGIMNCDTKSIIAIILVLQQTTKKNEIDLYNCLVDDIEPSKDEVGMYSHWMGTKYNSNLEIKLQDRKYFSPILNTGDLYMFSASRIHKLNNLVDDSNRIVLATFGSVQNNEIILYQ